jgi:hypothetical protein
MAEVSKIVRDRLAHAPVAGPHPDADLLTAFAERTLMAREREQVMAHLASCAGCREVVALAAPETAAAQEMPAVAAKPRWLPIPVMRWGAVTAAVVLVGVAVLLESPRYAPQEKKEAALQRQERESKTFSSPAPAASGAPTTPAQAESRAAGPAANEEKHMADAETAGLRKQKPATQPVETAKLGEPAGLAGRRDEAMEMDKISAAPAPPPAPSVATAGALAANAPKDQKVAATAEQAEIAQSKPAEAGASVNGMMMARAAAASPAPAKTASKKSETADYAYSANDSFAGGIANGNLAGGGGRLVSASLRWTVTSDGRVQRSPDGRNWYYVPIAKEVHFRALTNDGPRVWAGGNNAALYYSADAGETWKKQAIERLQGDIIRLVINSNTLTITTSSGQTMDISNEAFGDIVPKSNSPR